MTHSPFGLLPVDAILASSLLELDGRDWYKKGDWSNLLSEEQQIELGLKEAPKPAKPHIKLPLKNKTA